MGEWAEHCCFADGREDGGGVERAVRDAVVFSGVGSAIADCANYRWAENGGPRSLNHVLRVSPPFNVLRHCSSGRYGCEDSYPFAV